MPRDLLALDVRISQSRKSEALLCTISIASLKLYPVILGKPQSLTVVLFMGRNHIRKASIRLSSPSEKPSATFRCEEAIFEGGEH